MHKFLYIYSFTILILGSCGVKTRVLSSEDIFTNQYFSFNSPKKNWYMLGDDKWHIGWEGKGVWITIDNGTSSNGSLEIEVKSFPTKSEFYFDSHSNFEKDTEEKKKDPKRFERNREQGIGLDEFEVQYYLGMKCTGSVFSRNYGGDLYSSSSKNYSLTCGYYHQVEGKRFFVVNYRYYGATGESRLQKDTDIKSSDLPQMSEAEAVLKKDVEEVLNSVVLKDVDWERMKKEGLIHDKPFKTIKW